MNQMVEINLSLITEEKLRKKATSRGLPLGEYIEELARRDADEDSGSDCLTQAIQKGGNLAR